MVAKCRAIQSESASLAGRVKAGAACHTHKRHGRSLRASQLGGEARQGHELPSEVLEIEVILSFERL